ncbi:M56 family metallopeptidase [Sporosarcina sp. ACRSM]|uniref:M56 family metallopeptidase n=1 Tax=Sporosarcina sp. ACRSM TaxID=2918216 RepID=UPI001EF4520D|nr:M56 family metallopeptidase [Sporosarcina sp. ACRSM]MCG7335670.1 M56 family metallopeptidase [Sporosarcina sp. ACRSM]
MHKRHSTTMFIVTLMISGTILFQMGYYLLSMLAGWNVRFNLVAVCHSWLKMIGLSSLEYVLNALVIYTFLFSIYKIISQWVQASHMKKRFEQYKENKLTSEMNENYSGGQEDFLIFSHPVPLAITMGFKRPKIVLSTGLINLLNEEELKAVITHEMAHKTNRDPLAIFLMTLCAATMWYIPILKWFSQQYGIIKELQADEYAIEQQGTSVHLGSALLKMLKAGQPENMGFTYASFADTSVNYRMNYLLNPLNGFKPKLPMQMTILSLAVFSLISALFIYALA